MADKKIVVGSIVDVSAPYEGRDIQGNEKFGIDAITGLRMVVDEIYNRENRFPDYLVRSQVSGIEPHWLHGDSRLTIVGGV